MAPHTFSALYKLLPALYHILYPRAAVSPKICTLTTSKKSQLICRNQLALFYKSQKSNLRLLSKGLLYSKILHKNALFDSQLLLKLDTARSFLSRFAYRIQLRVLVFFSLFRQQRLSDFLLPWCCQEYIVQPVSYNLIITYKKAPIKWTF